MPVHNIIVYSARIPQLQVFTTFLSDETIQLQ